MRTSDLSGFCDELLKIAVSREASQHVKSRGGRRSIRVHNLMKKAQAPQAASAVTKFLGGHAPYVLGGTVLGAYGLHKGKEMLDEMRVGKRVLEQTGQR